MRYIIKCDLCKRKIGDTDDLGISASGGTCKMCRADTDGSYLKALRSKDNQLIKKIEAKANAGKMIRLM